MRLVSASIALDTLSVWTRERAREDAHLVRVHRELDAWWLPFARLPVELD